MAIVYLNYIPIDLFPKRINKVKLAFFFLSQQVLPKDVLGSWEVSEN